MNSLISFPRKTKAAPVKIPHGMYKCVPGKGNNGNALQEWYSARRRVSVNMDSPACSFESFESVNTVYLNPTDKT